MTSEQPADADVGLEPSFEEIVARLHEVVEQLESGDLPLEASLKAFEEGVRLSRLGTARLDDAERRVEELLGDGSTRAALEPDEA